MSNEAIKKIRDVFDGIDWETRLAERFAESWFVADRQERRARLRVITMLLSELETIRAISIFSTGLGEGLIEDIIDGDWQSVETMADHFRFEGEDEGLRAKYAPLWSTFRVLALGAVAEARRRAEGNPTIPS